MPDRPTGTVTFLFTDIEGSTRRWEHQRTAMQAALACSTPVIFNTNQGRPFTAQGCTTLLETANVRMRMDGRGRVFDNLCIERLSRTVKYEHRYLYAYETVSAVANGLAAYFRFYNLERPHASLAYRTPAEVHSAT